MYDSVWLSIVQCLKHVDVLLWYLPLLLLLLLLTTRTLIPICVAHTLHPIVKHCTLLWSVRSLCHRCVLLLAGLTFRACGCLCYLNILSSGLTNNLLWSINPIHCFNNFHLLDCCWNLMRVRVKDYPFLAWNWVLPPFCLLLDKMLLDWIYSLWLDSKLLRLVVILFGSTLISNLLLGCLELFLLLIMWPLWVQLCRILVPVLMPLDSKFILEHIMHVRTLYPRLQLNRSRPCRRLILWTPTVWPLKPPIVVVEFT